MGEACVREVGRGHRLARAGVVHGVAALRVDVVAVQDLVRLDELAQRVVARRVELRLEEGHRGGRAVAVDGVVDGAPHVAVDRAAPAVHGVAVLLGRGRVDDVAVAQH